VNDNGTYDHGCLCCGWMLDFGVERAADAAETAHPSPASTEKPDPDPVGGNAIMGTRILIQLDEAGPLPVEVATLLANAGAGPARPSHGELPGLYVAEVPEAADLKTVLEQLNRLPMLRYAEADAPRQAF